MPLVNNLYVSPEWANNQAPAINAAELNALCGEVASKSALPGQLPMLRGSSQDGVSYACQTNYAIQVAPGAYGGNQTGKGTSILFIPALTSTVDTPSLAINNGPEIGIRMRGAAAEATDSERPQIGVPGPRANWLLAGVPYQLTFCGLYWLVDSYIYEPLPEPLLDGAFIHKTVAQTTLAAISDGAGGIPVKALTVALNDSGICGVLLVQAGKNLLPTAYFDGVSRLHNGITYTVNADGSITVSGTATGASFFRITNTTSDFRLPPGTYQLTGCPADGSAATYDLTASVGGSIKSRDIGSGAALAVTGYVDVYSIALNIREGTTINATFYPMLSLAGGAYAPSVRTQTDIPFPAAAIAGGGVMDGALDVTGGKLTVTAGSATGTFTVTPLAVETLRGENVLFAASLDAENAVIDVAELALTYRADATLAYEAIMAQLTETEGN